MPIYGLANGPMQTTSVFAGVTTGTGVVKTMMQIKPHPTLPLKIAGYSISFTGIAVDDPIVVELIETDVAATVTAYVANDISKIDAAALAGGDPTTDIFSVSTTASGYTATGEGTTTVSRNLFEPQMVSPTNQFVWTFPLGDEPIIQISKFARIRVRNDGAPVNAICGMRIKTG
jgi:hypothetical protein